MFESLLVAGFLLGAVEGFKPGPLQTLVITETLKPVSYTHLTLPTNREV